MRVLSSVEITKYPQYICKCSICRKEYVFNSSDFLIEHNGYYNGYSHGWNSNAHCNCHEISSFQWQIVKILEDNNIKYSVEKSFPGLVGRDNITELRFDFCIYNDDETINCLIECQGQQHYEPVDEFGGVFGFYKQSENDLKKREFVKRNNIKLIEIPYTCDTYNKKIKFLKTEKIIQ